MAANEDRTGRGPTDDRRSGRWISGSVYAAIQLALLPLTSVGSAIYTLGLLWGRVRTGMSVTAFEPLLKRWSFHELGTRSDPASKALLFALPTVPSTVLKILSWQNRWVIRVTGYTPFKIRYPAEKPTGLPNMVGHRTEFYDRLMTEELPRITQVVILGAGWDTRAYSRCGHATVHYYEVDQLQTQTVKREAVARAGLDCSRVSYVAVDFNTGPWIQALKDVGFDEKKPALVLWEGVTYYLEEEAILATLDCLASEMAPGSVLAFDYPSRELVSGERSFGWGPRLQLAVCHWIGEPWTFGIPTVPSPELALRELLQTHGLRLRAFDTLGPRNESMPAEGAVAIAVVE